MTGHPGEPPVQVVEFTDPMCPWAWGSEPVFRRLRAGLGDRAGWRRVYAILFDDTDDPAPDPAAETAWYARHVEEISSHTGAPRAPRLRRVAASSWPSSLVAAAAELQGEEVARHVLRRLRESVFVLGDPADTTARATAAVRGVPGLDAERLRADASSPGVLERVRADRAEARTPVPEVLSVRGGSPHPGAARETPDGDLRYALPTLLVRAPSGYRAVPGWRPYEAYAAAFEELVPGLLETAARLSPGRALEHHRSLTEPERRELAPGAWPPPGAVPAGSANGVLWLHPDEASVHPATAASPHAGR
ncbi:DsbA family oxidoreductase [Streptomyces sp. NBC_00178]|uniref:DsbA family oxidoreductase n=1 Tax=Streptomyces sp. NBC_00178 TaxID=2975672 RepID=UPI003FA6E73E